MPLLKIVTIFLAVVAASGCFPKKRYTHEFEQLNGDVKSIVMYTDHSGYNYIRNYASPFVEKREYKKEADKSKSTINIWVYNKAGFPELEIEPFGRKNENKGYSLLYLTSDKNGLLRRSVKYTLSSKHDLDMYDIITKSFDQKKLAFQSRIETIESSMDSIKYKHYGLGNYSSKPSKFEALTFDRSNRVTSKVISNSNGEIMSRSTFSYQDNLIEEQRYRFKKGEEISSSTKIISFRDGIKVSERSFNNSEVQVIEYGYLKFDQHGNWLTRVQKHTLISQKMDVDIEPTTQTRVIEYR